MRDYKDAISARNADWKADAQGLMKSGIEFVVVHLKPEDYRDCRAMAREFGYRECLEDNLTQSQEVSQDDGFKGPTRIGFVKHSLSVPKSGQSS
jgi:hypothetical protein